MRLAELCDGWLDVPPRHRDVEVRGLACDSRRVRSGDLFVAVPGPVADGHAFAASAVAAGAVAVVGERRPQRLLPAGTAYLRVESSREALGLLCDTFYGRPSADLSVVGVTGTKGKTTTTWILDGILRRLGARSALIGTVENRIGERAFPSRNTTPGCLDLHAWLAEHRGRGGTHAILEVSSHAISQGRAEGVRFAGGIFTNIAPEHLDYHKTFESYLETKLKFFADLPSSAFAALSREERASQRIARSTEARIVWYGAEPQDGVERVRLDPGGLDFVWKGRRVRSRLLGFHNLLNLLAAMAAAEALGLDREAIAGAAELAEAPPGRLQDVGGSAPFRVVVDYAHTDGALEAVLWALRPVTPGRIITVFGCGGDRDRSKRPRMGEVAERLSDEVIVTSDNPRTESPREIIDDILAGLRRPDGAVVVEDRREAIGLGVRMAREGDTVLIAGKGHETYQEVGSETLHFDDREVARELLHGGLVGGVL